MNKITIYIMALAVLTVGCKKNLLDINTNPNAATYSTAQLTMPVALENAARINQTSYFNLAFWTGFWATSSGFSKPTETYTYDITSNFQSGTWDALYHNIADFNYVEQQAVAQKLPVYRSIAKIMKAYDFHQLVDLWGNVPYTDALQGANNLTPKYDQGQAIYDDLVKQIDSAIIILKQPATLNSINSSLDAQKIILFGNMLDATDPSTKDAFIQMWIKFANTLKLELLVNQSNIGRDAYIKGELSGLTTNDFLDRGEDATLNPGYVASTGKTNPFYGAFYKAPGAAADNYNSIKASDYGVKAYLNTNDPRISFYYDKKGASTYLGSVFGDPTGTSGAASVGLGLLTPNGTGPAIVMTAAESLFLQAEAAQRGYINDNAKTLFQEAVMSSFEFDGVPNADAAASTYMAQANPDVNYDLATDKIQVIITQKWFALNGIDILAVYNDYRRTGFPNVPLSTDPQSKGKVPIRLRYPQREITLNGANVSAQGTVDPFSTPVFWDK